MVIPNIPDVAPWVTLHAELWLIHRHPSTLVPDTAERVRVVKVSRRECWVRTKGNTEHKFTPFGTTGQMLEHPRSRAGDRSRFSEIVPLDDQRIPDILARQRHTTNRMQTERAVREFLTDPSFDTARAAQEALQRYLEEER